MPAGPSAGTAGTRLLALVGDPVGHSVSPAIHAAGIAAHGLDLAYLAFRVPPADLAAAVDGLWVLGAVGANVTAPHKEAVVALCASTSDAVRETGSANTLVRGADGWHAETTDGEGFLTALREVRHVLRGRAVVLGAGGAARAVVHALFRQGEIQEIHVVARRIEPARQIATAARGWAGHVPVRAVRYAKAQIRDAALVVNTTPVGTDDPDATPWPRSEDFRPGQTVYDLVYRPAETQLLRDARAAGATVIGGLPMLVAQAAASFRLWTGRDLPLAAARDAALRALDR